MKPILIGQAPSARSRSRVAFDGPSGYRLARILGTPSILPWFETANLLGRFPGKGARRKGDAFPMGRARAAARRLMPTLAGRLVVLAGSRVAAAFGLRCGLFESARPAWAARVLVIPHPSGASRRLNEPEARDRLREVLAPLLRPETPLRRECLTARGLTPESFSSNRATDLPPLQR